MECYCEPTEADDYCTVWDVTYPTARKEHKCCECGEAIKPGEKYERIFWVFDGEADTYKTCMFCATEFDRLVKKYPDDRFVKGDLACILVWDLRNEPFISGSKS